jgi:hypothetical protein
MLRYGLSGAGDAPMSGATARPRSLAPKEHGAWGQLGFPLLVALGLGRPSFVALGLAIAAVSMFVAHEPLVVLLGQRGTRAARDSAGIAKRRLALLLSVAAILGGTALFAGSWSVRYASAVSLTMLLIAFFGFLVKDQERSTGGEVWIACTLPALAFPVALAAEVSLANALEIWISLSLAYSAGIFGVRGIIRDFRERDAGAGWSGLAMALVGICMLYAFCHQAAAAAMAYWIVVAGCRMARPSPKALKRIGWILLGSSAVQAAWLLVALRFAG